MLAKQKSSRTPPKRCIGTGVDKILGYGVMKVLIIDDSRTHVHSLKECLARHDMEVLAAYSAEEGIKVAKDQLPDAILMDVVMPHMNGFQATRALRKDPQTSDIPIVIITTKSAETDRLWGMRQGAIDYLIKPIDEDQLVSRLKSLVPGS